MPSVINSSTSAGVTITSDTSAILQLQTASTAAVTIDASQNVGIGTASPANKLDVVGNIRSILASSGDKTGISLTNNGTTNGQVQFSTSDGSPRYYIQANGNTSLDFVTVLAGTNYTALSISRTTNNLTFGQSNAGIVFNNSSALTNSTLNDYETGTWTPTDASGAGIGITPTTSYYIKIGRQVTCWTQIQYPATANTSVAKIGGYPFVATSAESLRSGTMIGYTSSATLSRVLLQLAAANNDFRDSTGTSLTNAQMSGVNIYYAVTYLAST